MAIILDRYLGYFFIKKNAESVGAVSVEENGTKIYLKNGFISQKTLKALGL